MLTPATRLTGHLFKWPVKKDARTFRVYVVEPYYYDPPKHAAIFNGTLTALSNPDPAPLDRYSERCALPVRRQFDLVTFPEAFMPATEFAQSLRQVSILETFGCVHVGLRPSSEKATHLFSVPAIKSLIAVLREIPRIHEDDFGPLQAWLARQPQDSRFNLGCLFAIDANGKVRVCLHPKMVRSKFEVSPLEEKHMAEANLLTLVTLLPEDKVFLSVTLQPLLCSDALQLDTDQPGQLPLDGVNTSASCFAQMPPDNIDIVSIPTCTPQPEAARADGTKYRKWHQAFRNTFERVGNEGVLARHYHCTFVLSNFRSLSTDSDGTSKNAIGGLSGAFIPVPLGHEDLPQYAHASSYGRRSDAPGEDNIWSIPDNKADPSRTTRGYIVQLNPYGGESSIAQMLGFTITRFPRDAPRWKPAPGLSNFELRDAVYDGAQNFVSFRKREA